MVKTYAVGIDLGTTRSAVSFLNADGKTEMLTNSVGEVFTPSIVLFRDDERVVGHEAERMLEFESENAAIEVKRDMGDPHYRNRIQGKLMPPEVVQACILRSLRGNIVQQIGDHYRAVVTVPAYFDETRRAATLDAAKMADLDLVDIVNEPTAAAMAFGEKLGYLNAKGQPNAEMNILVYDLGGGTFDVTIVRMADGVIQTIATDGDMHLGGADWDRRMMDLIRERYLFAGFELGEDSATNMRLRRFAIDAKHSLSTRNEVTVRMDIDGSIAATSIARVDFESRTRDLVERTLFTTRQALTAAKMTWDNIGRILLVGGSTRMPTIGAALTEASGIPVDNSVNPDEAVSRGAAIYAQHRLAIQGMTTIAKQVTITNVNSHTLGIEGINLATMRKENSHIIPKNSSLPCRVNRKFVTKVADQRSVVIKVLEGEGKTADGCIPLGRVVLRNVPPGLPAGHNIHVEYRYDTNGRLAVRSHIPGYGDQALIELQRTHSLSDARLEAWKSIVCRDGGFADFETALDDFLFDDAESFGDVEPILFDDELPTAKDIINDDPAYDFDAPMVASEILKEDFQPAGKKKQSRFRNPPAAMRPKKKFWRSNSAATAKTKKSNSWRRTRRRFKLWFYFLGHIVASVIGLAVGYYLLVQVRPEANFLELEMPSIQELKEKLMDNISIDGGGER